MSINPFRRRSPTGPPRPPLKWEAAGGVTVEVYPARVAPGAPQKWYWRATAGNGEKIAGSGQGFPRTRGARRSANRVFPPVSS